MVGARNPIESLVAQPVPPPVGITENRLPGGFNFRVYFRPVIGALVSGRLQFLFEAGSPAITVCNWSVVFKD